jgi:AcrR family transcriptional regulator
MTSSLRERRRQLLHDEIIEAALRLIDEKGYGAMSMDELAAAAGISKPTLYAHFATKDELVAEAVTRDMRRMAEVLESHAGDHTPLQRLELVLRELLDRQMRAQAMGFGSMHEIFRLVCERDEALEQMQRINRSIMGLVRAGMERGEIDAQLEPGAVVRAFYGMMSALPKGKISQLSMAEPLENPEGLVRIFVRGVRA